MDSFKTFFDERLPDKCKFYSSLKNECIGEKDYLHAIDIWNVFRIKTMGDYRVLYLKTGLLLLTDVFKNLLKIYLLIWDTMLKMTGVIEKGMTGRLSYIAK